MSITAAGGTKMRGAACQKSLADPCAAVGARRLTQAGGQDGRLAACDGQRGALARGGAGWQGIKLSVGSAQAG